MDTSHDKCNTEYLFKIFEEILRIFFDFSSISIQIFI